MVTVTVQQASANEAVFIQKQSVSLHNLQFFILFGPYAYICRRITHSPHCPKREQNYHRSACHNHYKKLLFGPAVYIHGIATEPQAIVQVYDIVHSGLCHINWFKYVCAT